MLAHHIRLYGGKNLWISGTLSGAGNLTVDDVGGLYGDGHVILSAENTGYTGILTVDSASPGWSGGRISVNHIHALRNANLVMNTTRDILFGGGITEPVIGSLAGTGNLTIPATVNLSIGENNASTTYSGSLLGTGSLTKTGAGSLILAAASTHTGPIHVIGGSLLLNGSSASAALNVGNGATFGGTCTLGGTLDVQSGGTLAPGSSGVGVFTNNNAITLAGGAALACQIADWTGFAGTGWDKMAASSLNITATQANPFVIRVIELSLTHFTEQNSSFVILESNTPINGFDASKFSVDASGFPSGNGTWTVQQSGNNLLLAYTVLSPLETWRLTHFGSAAQNPAISGDTMDYDDDGLVNLMEYALGTDPKVQTPLALRPSFALEGDFLSFIYQRPPNRPDIQYKIQKSTTLAEGSWSRVDTDGDGDGLIDGIHERISAEGADPEIWRATMPTTNRERLYMRLKIMPPDP